MNTVIVENCKTLFIGRRGENEVTEVVFDFTAWQEQFGAGVIDLYVKRNLDVDAYPVLLSVDGTVATWLVTAADTDVVGNGKIEFVYTVDQKVAKSAVFPFFVGEDIGESSPEPPEHYQSWLEQLTELGAETQANAQAAAQSASEAAESVVSAAEEVDKARLFVEDAEAWAVGERGGEPVSEGDETYENNAKYWAENARTAAPVQSVNGEIGDVELTLDDVPNGESFVRTTPEQLAQITTNAGGIADINAKIPTGASSSNQLADKSYISNYYLTKAAQSATDAAQNVRINNINAVIPSTASAQNQLADQNSLDSKLSNYRTASQQNLIDNNKQTKITANGILKGNGLGGISAAVAGMDYLPTSALYAYRSANAQDAIDNAQNENINKNTAALNTMQPAATAADIGKALIVKTVADGKPTSYDYGEAGGGGSALTAGDGIDITNDVISNTQGIEYIVGTQTAATAKWTGNSTDEELKVGKIIAYYLPYAGATTAATLALTMGNGATTREISLQLKPNATVTTQFPAGSIIILVYDGSYWRVNASYDTDTNTNPTGYCLTNGSVAAKAAACSFGYRGDTNYFPCLFRFANTATDATLAITTYAPEAAPIYVNGARTSTTNTFSAGVILFLYYNGAYYCYNDGRFPILVDGAVTSVQEYAAGLSNSKQSIITATGILKGDGAGGVSSATAGTDYATPQQVSDKYTKPSDGIPSTDMTAAVQTSLQKADTALQEVPDTYRTAADQDVIDDAQDERLDAVEQTTTETTIGPVVIATFEASADNMPLKGLTVNIEPVQAEGTPSPENPLPISGWTGANVFNDPKHALKINWNQIRTDSAQTRTLDGITTQYDPQTHLFTITNNSRTTNFGSGSTQCVASNVNPIPGHRYALLGEYHAGVAVSAVNGSSLRTTASVGRILTMSAATTNTDFKLRITSSYDFVSAHPVGDVYSFYLNIVDITQLLGEEAAATATYDQIAEMFPNDWYPYNSGEITCVSAVNGDPHRKISVNWQNEAGTVYGGTFDVVNRKLNSYPYYSSYNGETIIGPWISSMDVYALGATPTLGAQVVDMGGAATSYDLSNVPEITTFLGTNNIWADTGDITVTYGAYLETVKSYADKVGDSILSAIAPLETSYTASRAYTVGSFLFVGTKFYKVTAAIAEGGTITPDTNVTQTTVAEQLMALANA